MSVYDWVIKDRRVIHRGDLAIWRCHFPGHDDGTAPEKWSCVGYPADGRSKYPRCWCYGCQRSASVVDLYVQMNHGVFTRNVDTPALKKLYQEAFSALDSAGFISNDAPVTDRSGRDFTEEEKTFLESVRLLMHHDLLTDKEALSYLKRRGVDPIENIGVARRHQIPTILSLSTELNVSTGLSSYKYPRSMHPALRDSIVVFQRERGKVVYYQARTLQKNRDQRYYNPSRIAKRPLSIMQNPSYPVFSAEGFFKVAWALRYGWNVWAPLGTDVNLVPTTQLSVLDGGIHMGDRNINNAGLKGIEKFKERCQLSGLNVVTALTPRGFTDPDEWAAGIGYLSAHRELQQVLYRCLG